MYICICPSAFYCSKMSTSILCAGVCAGIGAWEPKGDLYFVSFEPSVLTERRRVRPGASPFGRFSRTSMRFLAWKESNRSARSDPSVVMVRRAVGSSSVRSPCSARWPTSV